MNIAILTAEYFSDAVINLLDDAGYHVATNADGYGTDDYVLVDTAQRTYLDAASSYGFASYHPGSQFAEIQALLNGSTGGAAAPAAPAIAYNCLSLDVNDNPLYVGDTVLVITADPGRRDGKFVLPENGVLTITEITYKGAVGFGGADQYLGKRFQRVTLSAVPPVPASGTLVIAAPRRDGSFALPENKALVFRGLTTSGKFILDGYTQDQYAAGRFRAITLMD